MGISGISILTVFSLQNFFSARLRVLKTRSAMVHTLRIRSLEGKIGLSWWLGEWNSLEWSHGVSTLPNLDRFGWEDIPVFPS